MAEIGGQRNCHMCLPIGTAMVGRKDHPSDGRLGTLETLSCHAANDAEPASVIAKHGPPSLTICCSSRELASKSPIRATASAEGRKHVSTAPDASPESRARSICVSNFEFSKEIVVPG